MHWARPAGLRLPPLLTELESDDDVKVVVFRGMGEHFGSGFDATAVGETIPTMVKGPMNGDGVHCLRAGVGWSLYPRISSPGSSFDSTRELESPILSESPTFRSESTGRTS